MRIRSSLAMAAIAALTVTGAGVTAGTAAAAPAAAAPAASPLATYIVTVADGTAPAAVAARAARGLGGQVTYVYTAALNGFAITVPSAAADRLTKIPGVVAVEADQEVAVDPLPTQEAAASWGLDRIDQRTAALDGLYSYTKTGAGVTAYVIDTGIQLSHSEFGGQATTGYDAVEDGEDDCNGHGTHVAGTIGGAKYGVAKDVSLVAVRVLDCEGSGYISHVIDGVDWVTETHQPGAPAVANMSLGGGASTALDNAVKASIADGVTYAVAAGNGNMAGVPQDACKSSPARVATALTVAATNDVDNPAPWSNYGKCVDLFAPGVGITSAWIGTDETTNTISGTSMATPHVAGVAALYLQTTLDSTGATQKTSSQVADAIKAATTKDAVPTRKTANNDLLFTNY